MSQRDSSTLAPIPERASIDRTSFEREVVPAQQPVVIRDFAAGWPIVQHGRESQAALSGYIEGFGGNTPVDAFVADESIRGRFFYSDDLKGFNFERKRYSLSSLLRRLGQLASEEKPDSIYAGAIPLRDDIAKILDENVNTLLDPDVEQLRSIWIGNRGRTAAHWDLPQNIAVVCGGERTFTVFPPEQLKNLYVGPIDFTLAGQPISLVDLHEPDFHRFPLFAEALKQGQAARLGPGDALYLPSMWFHHVESHSSLGVLINYWWRESELYMFTPLFTLLHGLLSIRDLPEREREIWKNVFDHYLFQTDYDPMEHVPEESRSILRTMSPERVAGLRRYLLRSLGGVPRQ